MSSDIRIPGIHHVTAVTGDASLNVAFYTTALGMRLVKKTVNQDDVSAYHLFYGDRVGSPGTELTFFDWPHSPRAQPGAATVAPIGLSVPSLAALEWWVGRFDELGVSHASMREDGRRTLLPFTDPEGQRLELVAGAGRPGLPWQRGPVPPDFAVRGFHDVTVTSAQPEGTAALLEGLLGFRRASDTAIEGVAQGETGSVTVFETGDGGPGTQVRVVAPQGGRVGRPGVGGVHHVAFRTLDAEHQLQWRDRLVHGGVGVTPVIDRYYFRSIYFREPGGVLFEIATDGPGFTTDEAEADLGQRLSLPPFLEPRRALIEAGLTPIEVPPPPA